ncbi:hypothetical protein TNCV_4958031 [Trichonephila clavipes]|nr:hypothetical protein TNCV_4958031 [Trichonephila clavipes]
MEWGPVEGEAQAQLADALREVSVFKLLLLSFLTSAFGVTGKVANSLYNGTAATPCSTKPRFSLSRITIGPHHPNETLCRCCPGNESNDEKEVNNSIPIAPSSEMRNIMKSMRNYLDAHSNGKMNEKNGRH